MSIQPRQYASELFEVKVKSLSEFCIIYCI